MKPDYKNWMPKGLVFAIFCVSLTMLLLFFVFEFAPLLSFGVFQIVLKFVLLTLAIVFAIFGIWAVLMRRAFSYDGKRRMSAQIIEGISTFIHLPAGGKGLDVGCGSGALAIACAKKNPSATMLGVDRWGKEYASYSKTLCETNAKAEGVRNISFQNGDAKKLIFPDETFDAVTSNYVYHNIPSRNRQLLLFETLRVLKKGGVFAIHDIMSKSRYGDMQHFVEDLKKAGYHEVKLIDTSNGMFMSASEAFWMGLRGSTLLVGRK